MIIFFRTLFNQVLPT